MVAGNLTGLAGYAKQVSRVSLLEAVINIVLSVILVGRFGIYGVLYATVAALLVKSVYVNVLADRKIMNRRCTGTAVVFMGNFVIYALTVFLQYMYPLDVHTFPVFFLWGIGLVCIYSVIVLLMNLAVNGSFRGYIGGLIRKYAHR